MTQEKCEGGAVPRRPAPLLKATAEQGGGCQFALSELSS
jgi:hypothetical protein